MVALIGLVSFIFMLLFLRYLGIRIHETRTEEEIERLQGKSKKDKSPFTF